MFNIADFTKFDLDFQAIVIGVTCNFFFAVSAIALLHPEFITFNSMLIVGAVAISISIAWVFVNILIAIPYVLASKPYDSIDPTKDTGFIFLGTILSIGWMVLVLFLSYLIGLSAPQFILVLAVLAILRLMVLTLWTWKVHGQRYMSEIRKKVAANKAAASSAEGAATIEVECSE